MIKYIENKAIYKRNKYLNLNIYGKACHLQKKIFIFLRIRRKLNKAAWTMDFF